MSRQQKRIDRVLSFPKDLTWNEVQALLEHFGYVLRESGSSHVTFMRPTDPGVVFHISKPHNRSPPTLLHYQVKQLIEFLRERGHL